MKFNKKPLVTIISAVYNLIENNRNDYFVQMVNSVKNQTYSNIEHIIIDGGSTDGTIELLKKLKLNYISEPDNGIYDAFNKGINLAKGKYINFMNSDDYFNNNKAIELSVNALEKKHAVFSFAKASVYDYKNNFIKIFGPMVHNLYTVMPFCHQTMFVLLSELKELGGFDLNYKQAADYDLIIKLFLAKKRYVMLKDVIVTFRRGGISWLCLDISTREMIDVFLNNYVKHFPITPVIAKEIQEKKLMPLNILNAMPYKRISMYIYWLKRNVEKLICYI